MKATPIALYLEQKGRGGPAESSAARPLHSPFRPRLAAAAKPVESADDDDLTASDAPALPRIGLLAAVASRVRDVTERSVGARGEAASTRSPFFRAREPAAEPDVDVRLAEAYHRGVQEGLDSAREEAANARALERAEAQKRAVVERLDFQMNELAKLAEAIATAIGEVERRVCDHTARILKPFISKAISDQVIDELAQALARLKQGGRPVLIRIRGPERLLAALKKGIGPLAVDIEFSEEAGIEVIAEAGDTTISSGLQPWADFMGSLIQGS